jgi:hypothetical protein
LSSALHIQGKGSWLLLFSQREMEKITIRKPALQNTNPMQNSYQLDVMKLPKDLHKYHLTTPMKRIRYWKKTTNG